MESGEAAEKDNVPAAGETAIAPGKRSKTRESGDPEDAFAKGRKWGLRRKMHEWSNGAKKQGGGISAGERKQAHRQQQHPDMRTPTARLNADVAGLWSDFVMMAKGREVEAGIEPAFAAFAELCLTTWLFHR